MTARYLRQVPEGEPYDPTMTAVADLRVFVIGDVLNTSNGYHLITAIDRLDARTVLAHLLPIPAPHDGTRIHDLRDAAVRNFYVNGIMTDGRAPRDVMSLDEARAFYRQVMSEHS